MMSMQRNTFSIVGTAMSHNVLHYNTEIQEIDDEASTIKSCTIVTGCVLSGHSLCHLFDTQRRK